MPTEESNILNVLAHVATNEHLRERPRVNPPIVQPVQPLQPLQQIIVQELKVPQVLYPAGKEMATCM